MDDNLKIYNAVKKVPDEAKSAINGGRLKGKTEINPLWRIKVLTEQFGPCGIGWYYEVTKQWLEPSGTEVAAFVNILLFIKVGDEWSKPIHGVGGAMFVKQQNRCCFVQYLGGRFVLGDDNDSVNVTAWMPLPEPYRESEPHKQTNADRIRSMTDEELADFLVTVETYGYHDQSISGTYEMNEWLLMESEEEDGKV